jgi:hypothetical protein
MFVDGRETVSAQCLNLVFWIEQIHETQGNAILTG